MSELLYQRALSSDACSPHAIVLFTKSWLSCVVGCVFGSEKYVLAQEGMQSLCVRGLFVAAAQLRCLIAPS